jgi:uncharacterized lipoprotein YmbA
MRIALIGYAALAVLVGGCSLLSPRHDPSRFYTLAARPAGANATTSSLSVVVGPVTFPAYLDRNEVAVRVSPSELKYALTERWAEPLVQNFTRVLIENLGRALGSERVSGIVNATTPTPDYTVEVVVVRFEAGRRRQGRGDRALGRARQGAEGRAHPAIAARSGRDDRVGRGRRQRAERRPRRSRRRDRIRTAGARRRGRGQPPSAPLIGEERAAATTLNPPSAPLIGEERPASTTLNPRVRP